MFALMSKQASTTFTYTGGKYIVQEVYSTSSASMELSLGAPPPRMAFIIEELACTLTFCWATSWNIGCSTHRAFLGLDFFNQVLAVPGSGGEAGRSVGEGFVGAQRGESEAGHTLLRPERDVQLLNVFLSCCA